MGAAAVEPDVENVGDHLVIVGIAAGAEEGGGILRVPGVDALLADRCDDAVVHFLVDEQLAGLALDEQGDRHAPGALAAEHPVGAPLDHRSDAVAALFGDEAGVGDGAQCQLAERRRLLDRAALIVPALLGEALAMIARQRPVHRHEPLRRAAVDDLGLRPPRMRIAVHEVRAGGEQGAGFAQVRADRPVRRVELGVDDAALPAQPQPVLAILAVALDREHRVDAVRLAQLEIVLAMVGRHVDEARALVGGDEVARQERTRLGEEAAEMVHRVAGDGAGEVGALSAPFSIDWPDV